jgi:hypothetical protein
MWGVYLGCKRGRKISTRGKTDNILTEFGIPRKPTVQSV